MRVAHSPTLSTIIQSDSLTCMCVLTGKHTSGSLSNNIEPIRHTWIESEDDVSSEGCKVEWYMLDKKLWHPVRSYHTHFSCLIHPHNIPQSLFIKTSTLADFVLCHEMACHPRLLWHVDDPLQLSNLNTYTLCSHGNAGLQHFCVSRALKITTRGS